MFITEEPNAFPHHFVSGYNRNMLNREHRSTMMSYSSSSSSSSLGYIQHQISKLDTLAGIAIKYGVEVADVKKINGLVNDRQMFALKILHIPLAGKHSPSICLPNGSGSTTGPPDHACRQPSESFQSKRMKKSSEQISPAMIPLQDCYVTKPTVKKSMSQVFEMAVDKVGSSNSSSENGCSTVPERPLSHRKSKSLVDEILDDVMGRSNISPLVETMEEDDSDQLNDALVQKDQKLEGNLNNTTTPEWFLTQDHSSSGWISPRYGKGLALRQKAAFTTESESNGIRKSSSTSLLLDNMMGSSSFRRTSRCGSRLDLQASSTATSAKPTIDGPAKPITGRKNKTALD